MKQNNSFKTKLATLKWSWASLALAIVLLLINHKLIFGNAVGIWDADGQFLPYQILVSDFARQGKLLLWDCWTNAGIPTSGDPQVGAFSPINITIGLLFGGTSLGFIALWMFVWYLGGWGILMLGRHYKLPLWAAFVVALQFLFVGIYITNAEHTPWLVGFSFLPIIIWRLDVAIMAKSYFNAALAGAVWGLSALSAYPGFTIITGLFCFLWLLGSLFARNTFIGNFKKSVLQASLIFTCFTIVGLLVLSPTYFSFLYDAAGTTTRVGVLSKEAVLTVNPLHLGATATFASPLLAVQQLHNEQLYLGTDISMTSIYSGVLI
ncbi:MAG: hypothetical protein IT256_01215, partial [Chitinophagaceae bacterium]|nr:hypothetical protein [Chitinophagaceae bacterium]